MITDKDYGAKALEALLEKELQIDVGILEPAASKRYIRPPKDRHKDLPDMTIAEIASIHEFGLGDDIPSRPFIRGTFDKNIGGLKISIGKIKTMLKMGMSLEAAGNKKGVQLVKYFKDRVLRREFAPNDPETVEAKGSNIPLVHTGQTIRSISYRVNIYRRLNG